MRKTFKIPEHSQFVTIEATEEKMMAVFEKDDAGAFISNITEELEYVPSKDELAIFWGDKNSGVAVIGMVKDIRIIEDGCAYEANNGFWYNHAIRFRNPEQYNKILVSNAM